MKQQDVNRSLSFCTLLLESYQSRHTTPDVYIFLCILSHPFCSAWWISSPSDPLSPLSFSFPSLVPALSLSFMAYFCAAAQALVESWDGWGRGGWAMVGVHVFKQTEIFMYVCPCHRVRVRSRVPLLGLYIHMCVCSWPWHKEYSCSERCLHVDMCNLVKNKHAHAALFARWCVKPHHLS